MNNAFFPKQYLQKLAILPVSLVFISLILSAFITRHYFKSSYVEQVKLDIAQSLNEVDLTYDQGLNEFVVWCTKIKKNKTSARYTVIHENGDVLCDTSSDPNQMDNHINRVEVKDALQSNFGFSIRYSKTTQFDMVYGAKKIQRGDHYIILRKSISLDNLIKTFDVVDRSIFYILIVIFILLVGFSIYRSRELIRPFVEFVNKLQTIEGLSGDKNKFDIDLKKDFDLEQAFNSVYSGLSDYIDDLHIENDKNQVLINSMSDGILAVNNDENVLFINEMFKSTFLPFYADEDFHGKNLFDLLRHVQIETCFKDVLSSDLKKQNLSIEILHRNNQKGFYDLRVTALENSRGEKIGALGIFQDISAARLTDQMRTDFVTNVSHEVRTPLTAMKGFIQIILAHTDDLRPELRSYLNRIEYNCDRLIRLFNDVLNLSVINSKLIVNRDEIDTRMLLSNVVSNVKQSYLEKKIEFIIDTDNHTYLGESDLIEQVLTNLIDNASKYNNENGKVLLSWKMEDNTSVFIVEDSGIGIKEKHYPRLFERFYRVDPSRSREMGGTGLGLALVKHIVQKHSGKIEVEKSELGGTCFKVSLPIISV